MTIVKAHLAVGMALLAFGRTALTAPVSSVVSQEDKMQQTLDILHETKPSAESREARRRQMRVIQEACDNLSSLEYKLYELLWTGNPDGADELEAMHPALRYLRAASQRAFAEIKQTEVSKGMAVWLIYNMGYVFKTPDSCFAIDLKGRDTETLAGELDFLLITHEHNDHNHAPLINAMLALGKPVLSRDRAGASIVTEESHFTFGSAKVRVELGDHHCRRPDSRDNMLMYEVVCSPASGDALVYHSGDNSNIEKMRPARRPDFFIPHIAVGLSVPDAIERLNPRMTLVSHLLELGHPVDRWRWSFDYTFDKLAGVPPDKFVVLTWGERYLLPGTELGAPAPR